MRLIAYISDYALTDVDPRMVVDAIVAAAAHANVARGITGVLFFVNNKFVQILEGEDAPLTQLMKNIESDRRHKNVTRLIDKPIVQRGFHNWSMALFCIDNQHYFDKKMLRLLTKGFEENDLLRSDVLAYYYKAAFEASV
ncbi:MAG: BLUF domain-containing protein [Proteobacteria bacterium]|nr:BLUF domain-containing protein [Pseudomonadota bacterium]